MEGLGLDTQGQGQEKLGASQYKSKPTIAMTGVPKQAPNTTPLKDTVLRGYMYRTKYRYLSDYPFNQRFTQAYL